MPDEIVTLGSLSAPVREVTAAGRTMRLSVANGRLGVWADRFSETEPELLDFLSGMSRSDVFFDIGASIGHFSIFAAGFAGSVYAFEAEAQNYATASINLQLNGDLLPANCALFHLAVSDGNRVGELVMTNFGAGEHTKSLCRDGRADHTTGLDEPGFRQTVLEMSLDDAIGVFGLPQPTHLKIDVDGAELKVLEGAKRTLADSGLRRVFIELEDTTEGRACRSKLETAGFALVQERPVVRLSGGYYEGLTNCVFQRDTED